MYDNNKNNKYYLCSVFFGHLEALYKIDTTDKKLSKRQFKQIDLAVLSETEVSPSFWWVVEGTDIVV